MSDTPEPIDNIYALTGILPGHGWKDDLLDGYESDDGRPFLANWIAPISEDALTQGAVAQAKLQFERLFPNTNEREREMFMAGVATMLMWWSHQSIHLRNTTEAPDEHHMLAVGVDELDEWVGAIATRLITIVFNIDDDPDLDDAFADIVENL